MEGTVLLTGASGLLGSWLARTAPEDSRIVGVQHRTPITATESVSADLTDAAQVRAAFATVKPSVVIHAAYAKNHRSIVGATNHLAAACTSTGAHLVYISTDAVFSGDGKPKRENSTPDPIWDYGRWKADAEALAASTPSATIVRLPLVVSLGPEDHVVHSIKTAAHLGEQTLWFTDELRQPALARELAHACWRIASLRVEEQRGVWHLPGAETLTRYDVADRVVRVLDLDPSSIVQGETPQGAQRPRHLWLTDERARNSIGWRPNPVLTHTQER